MMPRVRYIQTLGVSFLSAVRALEEKCDIVLGSRRPALFKAEVAGVELAHDVKVVPSEFGWVDRPVEAAALGFRIEATDHTSWFPIFEGDLELTGLGHNRVEVALEGEYRVPASILGRIADRAGLHALAESSLERFFGGVVSRLRTESEAFDALTGVPG